MRTRVLLWIVPLGLAPLVAPVMAQDRAHHPAPVPQSHAAQPPAPPTVANSKAPKTPEHVGHDAMGRTTPVAVDRPRTPIPPATEDDRAAAFAYADHHAAHDDIIQTFVLFDRLERFDTGDGAGLQWEARSWIGTDRDKLWLRSEGERSGGRTETADLEVLYGRAYAPWWDAVVGVRHDFEPGRSQDFLAIGAIGVAPYKFEIEATAFLGERGQTGARFAAEYEALLTNRLILQPLIELNLHGRNDPTRGIGSGLGSAEAGLRLRYETAREFAPYIGVTHERTFGRTADFRREEGEATRETRIVAGVRVWF